VVTVRRFPISPAADLFCKAGLLLRASGLLGCGRLAPFLRHTCFDWLILSDFRNLLGSTSAGGRGAILPVTFPTACAKSSVQFSHRRHRGANESSGRASRVRPLCATSPPLRRTFPACNRSNPGCPDTRIVSVIDSLLHHCFRFVQTNPRSPSI